MTRMITAMFDTRGAAEAAASQLVREMALDRDAVRLHGGSNDRAEAQAIAAEDAQENRGVWAALRDLFVPDEDRTTYAEGLRRGAFLVSAEVEESRVEQAMDVLEAHGAVDLDSREAQWRSSQSGATASMPGAPGVGVAGTTDEKVIARPGGAGGSLSNHPAPGSMTNEEGRLAGAGLAGATPSGTSPRPAPGGKPSGTAGDREVIPVVEERVRIGKRDVERGRVRVRSYIVETPVSEQVSLHDEKVNVERRPADRPVGAGDEAFRERTIEAVERGEEAVVAKEARVTGEVVVSKEGTDHTETVKGTARRTEVKVDDDSTRGGKARPRKP